jgi:hypothetical protein
VNAVPNSTRYPKGALRPLNGWDWRQPTGTYGVPSHGEPHPTAFGQATGITPTAEQVAADHAEALRLNTERDAFNAAFAAHNAQIRAILADGLDFGDVTDPYDI